MATSEILGLFQSPDQYRAAQEAAMQQQFAQRANLAPLQKASILAQQAGYRLGQGVGGALGGTDPQLDMISRRNALLSQLDQGDPESFMKVAQAAAQIGDNEFAMAIANAGRKAQSEMALTTQRTAEKMTNEQRNALAYASQFGTPDSQAFKDAYKERFDQLTLKAGQANKPFEFEAKEARLQELKAGLRVLESQPTQNPEAIKRLKDSIQAIEGTAKPEPRPSVGSDREAIALDEFDKNYYDLTPIQRAEVNKKVDEKKIKEAKATATPAAVQAKAVSKNKTDLAAQVETDAYGATDRVTLARNLKSLLPTAFTGVDANLKLQASRVAEVFGINIQGVPDSQIIDTILGEMTIGAASKLKGGLSDKDVKFLKETIGTRGLSLKTLQFVANKIEEDALIDAELNEVVNRYVASGDDLNKFNFASQRKNVAEKVRKDKQRLEELRNKAKTQ